MEFILAIFAGVLGAVIGSFLNVVILRYNSGLTLGGRSMCLSCGKSLKWYELIPIVSFVFLKGKCRKCGTCLLLLGGKAGSGQFT